MEADLHLCLKRLFDKNEPNQAKSDVCLEKRKDLYLYFWHFRLYVIAFLLIIHLPVWRNLLQFGLYGSPHLVIILLSH